MAMKDWFSRKTPLQLALDRGTRPGADLSVELSNLGEYSIQSQADAEAICEVLARVAPVGGDIGGKRALHSLIGLFQDVEDADCPAYDVMVEKGLPLLIEIVDDAVQVPSRRDEDDVLFALKVLAMYGTEEGTDAVIRAARRPLHPDGYMWSIILGAYTEEHAERDRVFDALRDPLPTDFLGVALLDGANGAILEGADMAHPFDSTAGKQQIERWLTDRDPDHFSYAISATAAIPFIHGPEQDVLLALAFDHVSHDVQLEAAWAAAKLGREAGVRCLARMCLDVNLADRAKRYLAELDRGDAIPAEAEEADFQAKAEFAQWLAHPCELGRAPDELEILDHRELKWPPNFEPTPVWLIKYRAKNFDDTGADDVDVGMVGSVTFCLFSYELKQRPPEDGYAIHCYWEMRGQGLIEEIDIEEDSTEYDRLLQQGKIDGLGPARVILVVELSPELRYPQKLVALAKGTRDGEPGWVVCDGARSRWYAAAEMPAVDTESTVVMVHVGRELLGFREEPDRRRYLAGGTSIGRGE